MADKLSIPKIQGIKLGRGARLKRVSEQDTRGSQIYARCRNCRFDLIAQYGVDKACTNCGTLHRFEAS